MVLFHMIPRAICVCICMLTPSAEAVGLTVNTTSGIIQGEATTFDGKTIHQFQNVPFAEPPIGDLRFMPPEPKSRLDDTVDATNDTIITCPQIVDRSVELSRVFANIFENISTDITEDCLYLNVYTSPTASDNNLLPVLVWIHGGAFVIGAGRLSSGLVLSSQFDVVVVTINYRLGALGFLNTEDDNAIGNFGLLDQIMALKWVKANIAQFGGDMERITIAGESAGGASVSQLAISPLTDGLFQRAIIQSGSPYSGWAFQPYPLISARSLAEAMKCPTQNTRKLVDCLKSKTVNEILAGQTGISWAPGYNGDIFPQSPWELAKNLNSDVAKRLAKLDVLMGVNAQEGALVVVPTALALNYSLSIDGIPGYIFETFLQWNSSTPIPREHTANLLNTVRYKYTDWTMPDSNISRAKMLVDMMGDIWFNVGAVKFARLHNQVAPAENSRGSSYFYQFNHRPSFMSQAPWRTGADHGDDLFFVFGNPLEYQLLNATSDEKELSQRIMRYWTNFLTNGNPNGPITVPVEWPQYEKGQEKYLRLDTQMSSDSVGQGVFASRVAFWADFIPQEIQRLNLIPKPAQCDTVTPTSTASTSGGFLSFASIFLLSLSLLREMNWI